jgi:hypothetical protein
LNGYACWAALERKHTAAREFKPMSSRKKAARVAHSRPPLLAFAIRIDHLSNRSAFARKIRRQIGTSVPATIIALPLLQRSSEGPTRLARIATEL